KPRRLSSHLYTSTQRSFRLPIKRTSVLCLQAQSEAMVFHGRRPASRGWACRLRESRANCYRVLSGIQTVHAQEALLPVIHFRSKRPRGRGKEIAGIEQTIEQGSRDARSSRQRPGTAGLRRV